MTARILLAFPGLDAMINDLEKVGRGPGHEVTDGLEGALAKAYAQTQTQVHIGVTTKNHAAGTLKASGRTRSDLNGKTWSGDIEYGGRHGTPAYYAIYEMNRGGVKAGTDTPHDFFAGLDAYDGDFEAAIDRHFEILGGGA